MARTGNITSPYSMGGVARLAQSRLPGRPANAYPWNRDEWADDEQADEETGMSFDDAFRTPSRRAAVQSFQDDDFDDASRRKSRRAKRRASRMFDKQFGSDLDQPSEGPAPRAALYETEMGASHRRAARMQRSSQASPASAKINPTGWLSNITVKPRTLKIGTAVLCLVLACTFLYVPAQHYYKAQREHDRLQAEYTVLQERNAALDFQNDSLASDAGLEDAVREKYGYVQYGEETAIVTGLSEEATDTSRNSNKIEANVLSSSVKAPEEWYTPLLDAFFGVE